MSDTNTDTSTTTNALTTLMSLVTEKRTLVQFQIAEKSTRTYRIKAPSWRAAKEMINETHSDGGNYFLGGEPYDQDYYYEEDGCYQHIQDYAPTFDEKIKQVKIGYEWYDLQQLVWEPTYYLTDDYNIGRVLAGYHQEVVQ